MSPMILAFLFLYLAHVMTPPILEFWRAGGNVLNGFGHLLNESTRFTFETLREAKAEVAYTYNGVNIHSMALSSTSWCVEDQPLIPEQVIAGNQEVHPEADFKTLNLLRASVNELARGTKKVRHIVREFNVDQTHRGSAALLLGRRNGDSGSFCVSSQYIEVSLEWSSMLFRPLSKPSVVNNRLLPGLHNSVRTSLLAALETDFPESVTVQRMINPPQE